MLSVVFAQETMKPMNSLENGERRQVKATANVLSILQTTNSTHKFVKEHS